MRVLLLLSLVVSPLSAAPKVTVPAPEFAVPQSPTKPPPFPIRYVDQGTFDPKLRGMFAPEGFQVEIVAESPVVVNPVGMTFGPDGNLYVLEWAVDSVTQGQWFEFKETFHYKDGTTKQVATMKKFVMDPVKVLKRNAKTGRYDSFQTIIGEELPSMLLYHDGWLYTASRGTVRRYRQSRVNGPWDIRETIAQGFCGFHHHQVSGLTIGNDGKLYITSGDDDNFVEGSDGSRATVLRTGAIFRCNPDGSQMETYSLGYRNPYRDIAYDDKFNFFHADNDNEDGSKFTGCRLVHVAEGVDYGWRLQTGARCCRPDFTRGAVAGERPGTLPPMLKTGRGSPAGVLIYNDTRLPEQYRKLMYYPDVFRKVVRAYTVEPDGASFAVTHEFEFLKSDDPLFRPCQMVTGPDGAMYVCDWRTDSGGAGRLSGDGTHGRIYRVKWVGTKDQPALPLRGLDSWAKLLKLPNDLLVAALNAPDMTDRVEARKELVRRGAEARDLVLQHFISGKFNDDARLVAIGVMQASWTPAVADLFRLLLNDVSPDVRRLAVEALAFHTQADDLRTAEAIQNLLTDDNLAVRRAAALAFAKIGGADAADSLVAAYKFNQEKDPFLIDGYIRAIERLGSRGMAALLVLANSGDQADLAKVTEAFAAFRSRPAFDALPKLFQNPHITTKERASLLRSFANYQFDPPISLQPLVTLLAGQKSASADEIVAGLEVLTGTQTISEPFARDYVLSLLDSGNETVFLATLQAVEDSRLSAASSKLTTMLSDRKRSVENRAAILKALRTTAGKSAIPALVALLAGEEPATLKVDALRALAAADAGKAQELAGKLLNQPDPTLLAEAVIVLGTTKAGALLIGKRYLAKQLPRDLFPRVTESLAKFGTDPAVRTLTGEVRKGALLLSLDPARTEEIRKLVFTKGDAERGKALYLNTKVLACANCHQLEGTGGNVGPDLTRVWDTHTIDKILEAIVAPSKEIKEGYQSFKATTLDGRVFTGLKVIDTNQEVVIREATGRDIHIPRKDLDELDASKTSLMPDNAASLLTFDQFIDLLAFLKNRSAQEEMRGTVVEAGVAIGFPPKLAQKEYPEKNPDPTMPNNPNEKAPLWQFVAAKPDGTLDLAPLLPKEPTAAYVVVHLFSPTKQKVKLTLTTDDDYRLIVGNDARLLPTEPVKPDAKTQPKIRTVEVPPGTTPILVKLVTTGKNHELRLRFEGTGLRVTSRPIVGNK